MWLLAATPNGDLGVQLRELLSVLPEPDTWRALLQGNRADVHCSVDVQCDVCGLAIDHDVLMDLGRRNLDLSIEMYVVEDS